MALYLLSLMTTVTFHLVMNLPLQQRQDMHLDRSFILQIREIQQLQRLLSIAISMRTERK